MAKVWKYEQLDAMKAQFSDPDSHEPIRRRLNDIVGVGLPDWKLNR